jgi:hypothetical protein
MGNLGAPKRRKFSKVVKGNEKKKIEKLKEDESESS